MSRQTDRGMTPCCAPEIKGNRYLLFPDGCRIGVKGLDGILDDAYREGEKPDQSVANELVRRLSENNYIPLAAWAEYEEVVLREFKRFVETKEKSEAGSPHPQQEVP